ncbi:MAG: hypothetical protein ACYS80_17200 [Planctomycetota bacterium]|jgi:hypothetical protein
MEFDILNRPIIWSYVVTDTLNVMYYRSITYFRDENTLVRALGGSVKATHETTVLEADIDGRAISTHAIVIDSTCKDENGRDIEVLFESSLR